MRKEKDALGVMDIPDDAYYGIQTMRAVANFDVTNRSFNDLRCVIRAAAEVKKACAMTNRDIKALAPEKAEAIVKACDEIIAGGLEGQFPVNVWRSHGTSVNMNVNEVIANRANEILTGKKGYDKVHPNTHVNMCQSSNDIYPVTECIVLYREVGTALEGVKKLEKTLAAKAFAFKDMVRLGRTCMQDAVPVTMGQAFAGFHAMVCRNRKRLEAFRPHFQESVLGATVLGTGMGQLPGYRERIHENLSAVVGFPMHLAASEDDVLPDASVFDSMQNGDGLMILGGYLKALACAGGKIAQDLYVFSSGPRGGIGELNLPAVAPGSSIMPGKINPFMPEMMMQVMQKVSANEWAATLNCAESELDLGFNSCAGFLAALESLELIGKGFALFAERCVDGLTVNEDVCREYAERSTSLSTMVSALYGYEVGSRIARIAYTENITCKEAALREKLIPADVAEELFDVRKLADRAATVDMFRKYSGMRRVD